MKSITEMVIFGVWVGGMVAVSKSGAENGESIWTIIFDNLIWPAAAGIGAVQYLIEAGVM